MSGRRPCRRSVCWTIAFSIGSFLLLIFIFLLIFFLILIFILLFLCFQGSCLLPSPSQGGAMKYWLPPLTFLGLVTLAAGLEAGDGSPGDPTQAIVLEPARV